MQVFKLYFKILKNATPVILIYLIILFSLIIFIPKSKNNKTTGIENVKVNTALVNYDKDSIFVEGMIKYLNRYCEFTDYTDREEELADALFFHHEQYILTIPYHFGDDFLSGKNTGIEKKTIPDSNHYILVDNAINSYLNISKLYYDTNTEMTENELVSYMSQLLTNQAKVTIESGEEKNNFNNNYFNIASYIMLSCFLFAIGAIIITFHNTHIKFRNMVTPMKKSDINLQIAGGNLIFVFSFDIFIILLGYIINPDKVVNGNVILYWLNLFAFSISALSGSYLVALLVKSRQAVNVFSIVLSLGVCFISGAFIPQNMLGESILKLASFTPLYWFIKGNDAIAGVIHFDLENIKDIIWYMLIQLGFALTGISVSLVISKAKRLNEN